MGGRLGLSKIILLTFDYFLCGVCFVLFLVGFSCLLGRHRALVFFLLGTPIVFQFFFYLLQSVLKFVWNLFVQPLQIMDCLYNSTLTRPDWYVFRCIDHYKINKVSSDYTRYRGGR